MKKFVFSMLAVLVPCFASAEGSRDFAMEGRKSWASFECSALSSVMKDKNEEERLFKLGYEAGKKFLNAVQAGKVNNEDLYDEVPTGFTFAMFGPSVDFRLGRIYEIATDNATKGIFVSSNGSHSSEDTQKALAQTKYLQRNCKLMR